jgi:hypothetical protein
VIATFRDQISTHRTTPVTAIPTLISRTLPSPKPRCAFLPLVIGRTTPPTPRVLLTYHRPHPCAPTASTTTAISFAQPRPARRCARRQMTAAAGWPLSVSMNTESTPGRRLGRWPRRPLIIPVTWNQHDRATRKGRRRHGSAVKSCVWSGPEWAGGKDPITTHYLQEGRGPQGSTMIRIVLSLQPFGSAGKLDLAPWLSALHGRFELLRDGLEGLRIPPSGETDARKHRLKLHRGLT